eukprot:20506_1
MYPQDVNKAINYIESQKSQDSKPAPSHDQKMDEYKETDDDKQEHNDVKQCDRTLHLISTLKRYKNAKNMDVFLPEKRKILNNFHYFLHNYNSNNEAMHYVHSSIPECDFKTCNSVQRQYRVKQCDNKTRNPKGIVLQDTFDRIHCYFAHCYDLGSRLTRQEEQQLNRLNTRNESIFDNNVRSVLANKREKMNFIMKPNAKKQNKFCSNLGQSKVSATMYSFGFRFFYWDFHKNFEEVNQNTYHGPSVGEFFSTPTQLYVPAKYDTFRQELTQNSVVVLTADEYEKLLQNANDLLETEKAKKIGAHIDGYMKERKSAWSHISTYGIRDRSPIALYHILALITYTDMDNLQREFSATYRLKTDESLNELKWRHSNFHFLGKYLREAVECFGDMAVWNDTVTFYHGINCMMQFKSVSVGICGPLSTTTVVNVAMNFATNNGNYSGIIVAMRPNFSLKYWDCKWISRYPHEMECFYIGGILPQYFMNIINLKDDNVVDTKHFVTAIRLIEEMCTGRSTDLEKLAIWLYKKKGSETTDVKKLGLKPLGENMKQTVKELIRHELHRNGVKEYNASEAKLDVYIDGLMHSVCSQKQEITISLKCFDVDQYEQLCPQGGYIGYSFLKNMFGEHPISQARMLNLDILCLLFPNVERILIIDVYKKEWIINLICDTVFAFKNYKNLKIIDVVPQQKPDEIFQTVVSSVAYIKNLAKSGETVDLDEHTFDNLKDHYLNEVTFGKMVRIERIQ